jgi:hypothetical protein
MRNDKDEHVAYINLPAVITMAANVDASSNGCFSFQERFQIVFSLSKRENRLVDRIQTGRQAQCLSY